ncbi:MAG: DUF917 domain-containing protein [Desulfurococcales archaeon]|nr:DUF917 domain-containing protein [Desulfurococcales archaeon]
MFVIKTQEDAENLVLGATVLGTGGGGSPSEGLKLLSEVLNMGKEIKVVDLSELPEDSIIVSPYYIGTIAPTAKTKKPVKIEEPIKVALDELEKLLGKKASAVVACELGGGNTPVAMYIAAKLGLPVVDGDLLGRAAPELHKCTVHIFDIPMYPAAIVSETGNVVIVKQYADIDDYESIARYLSVLAGRFVAAVDTPMTLDKARKAVVRGTISLCIKVGRAIREARAKGEDPVQAAVKALDGWKIFEGVVDKYEWRDEGGFLRGEAYVKGVGKWEGKTLKTWIMNEHIMAWIDGEPATMAPDLIMFLRDDGEPVTNTELKVGDKVNVVVAKAPEVWRTPKGLELFGPKHFGFDYDYVPVEELVKRLTL